MGTFRILFFTYLLKASEYSYRNDCVYCHFLIPTCLCLHDCFALNLKLIQPPHPPPPFKENIWPLSCKNEKHPNSTEAPLNILAAMFKCESILGNFWSMHEAARQYTGLECSTVCSGKGGRHGEARQSRCSPSGGVSLTICSQTPFQIY